MRVLAPGYAWNGWSDGNTIMTGRSITVTAKTNLGTSTTLIPTYTVSTDKTALDFGYRVTGYVQPTAVTVIVTNTGNQSVTLTKPTAANYDIGMLSKTELAPGETATFTVGPRPIFHTATMTR